MDLSAVRQSGIFQDSPLTSEPSTEESRNKRPDGEKTDHTKLSSYERKEEKKKAKKRKKKNRSYLSEAAQTAEAFLQQARYTEKQILHIVTLIIMSIIFKSYFF